MTIRNNINLLFGLPGKIGGFIFILSGIWICFCYNLNGILILLPGAFIAFSTESTLIDTEKRKIVHTSMWFGIFETGNWIDIKPVMKLQIRKPDYRYLPSGKKRRMTEAGDNFYYILLCDENDEFILPVKKYKLKQNAEEELQGMKKLLGLK
jgi:hypothetical protein